MLTWFELLRYIERTPKAPVELSYLICSTPRSGSTRLCECLALTGVAGVPEEWLLPTLLPKAMRGFPITAPFADPEYLRQVVTCSSTPNGVFGAKVMWTEMEPLRRGERWGLIFKGEAVRGSELLPNLRYVRITRRDRLRQAVSLMLAMRTDLWHKTHANEHLPLAWTAPRVRADLAVPAERQAILRDVKTCLDIVDQQESEWDRFFADEGIVPLSVLYEDLTTDPTGVTRRVLDYLGIPCPEGLTDPKGNLMKMSDERNELLVEAYTAWTPSGRLRAIGQSILQRTNADEASDRS